VPDDDLEVISYLSNPPLNDVYDVSHDPYAAFDPDVSAASEDANHDPAESVNAQRSFKKIGVEWGAMVSAHSTDRSHQDSQSQYSEVKSVRRDTSYRKDRRKNRGGWRRSAAVRSPSEQSPELSVQDQAVGTSPQLMNLVNEEVQTTAEEAGLSSPFFQENYITSCNGVMHHAASAEILERIMINQEVQCSAKTADTLKKEYTR